MPEGVPSHVGGYTIMSKALRFGMFGVDYLGHNNDGLRLVKLLREGEGVALAEDAYTALKDDAQLLHFEPVQALSQDQRVLAAHTVQAAALGVLVGGSPLQTECVDTTREFDAEQKVASSLRSTTLVQKAQLVLQLARLVERLHKEQKTFPYLTPWNTLLEADQVKLTEVGLGLKPDDGKFDVSRVPEDALVYLAPEVLRAVAQKTAVQVSPAADVYAMAATARSILLNRVADPAVPPGPPPAKDAAAPSRRDLALKAGGLALAQHTSFSRELEQLLRAALSLEPARRPTASAFAEQLNRLIQTNKVEYVAPPVWPQYAAIAGGVVVALLLIVFVLVPMFQDPPERVQARRAYAEATRLADPTERAKKLEEVKVPTGEQGTPMLLPESRRLLAVTRYITWARSQKDGAASPPGPGPTTTTPTTDAPAPAGPKDGGLAEVLGALDRDVVQGHDDALAQTTRFLVAWLRRWEVGGPERAAADKELEALAKPETKPDSLRDLAAAARALTATGVEKQASKDDLMKWLEAAGNASADSGFLSMPYQAHKAEDGYEADAELADKPQGVALEAAWVGRLIAGRIQAELERIEDARSKFASAKDVSIFATNAAYGLALAEAGTRDEDFTLARQLIEAARARRGPFGEGALALGALDLRAAHALPEAEGTDKIAAAYARAIKSYSEATSAPADTPGADMAKLAAAGELQARFYRAIALAADAQKAADAEPELDDLLKRLEEAPPELTERYQLDAQLALGLVRQRRGQPPERFLPLIRKAFKNDDPAQGLDPDLPQLEPAARTRAAAIALGTTGSVESALVKAEALWSEEKPSRQVVDEADRALKAVEPLVAGLPEEQKLRALLAQATVQLAYARAGVDRAIPEARNAFKKLLETITPAAANAEQWLKALEGQVQVYQLEAERAGSELRAGLDALKKAGDELRGWGERVPPPLRRPLEQLVTRLMPALNAKALTLVDAATRDHKTTIMRVDPAPNPPRIDMSEAQVGDLIYAFEGALTTLGDNVPDAERFRVAEYRYLVSVLHRVKGNTAQVFEHAMKGLDLLGQLGQEESRVTDLKKHTNYLVGIIALKDNITQAPASVPTRDMRQFAKDSLARACGASDWQDFLRRLKGNPPWTPVGPPTREQAPQAALAADIVARYATGIPKDPVFGQAVNNAQPIADELTVATIIDSRNANTFILLARVLYSIGESRLDACVEASRQAYTAVRTNTASDEAALEARVQASRLFCNVRSRNPGQQNWPVAVSEAVKSEEFRQIAQFGKEAAVQFVQRGGAGAENYNYGPIYWYARSLYEEALALQRSNRPKPEQKTKFEQAKAAYEEFRRLIEGKPVPNEAGRWQLEFNNTVANLQALAR